MLSALAPEIDVAYAAISAVAAAQWMPQDRVRLSLDVILAAVPHQFRRALETHMQGYEYQSEFARKYVREGQLRALRDAALALLQVKLDIVTDADHFALAALGDAQRLTELISALARAASAADARAALAVD